MESKPIINKTSLQAQSITYEPGDCTLYSFFVYVDYDDAKIIPDKSTFRLPQTVNKWDVLSILDQLKLGGNSDELGRDYLCNPHTLKAVCEVLKILFEL